MTSQDELQAQLRDLDAEIARLKGEDAGVTDQLGGDGAGPQDPEDIAAATTNLEENQAILATLEARRTTLVQQLGD